MSDPIIQISALSRSFGSKEALNNISLEIPRGMVYGLVGENGAGKTTLIKHILGLLRARTGSVRVFGMDPVAHPEKVLARIGYLSEDRDLPDWMRVGELLRYTRAFYPSEDRDLPDWMRVGELLRYTRAFYPDWDDAYAEELRATFGLEPHQRLKTLSRGQLAQAGLLIALAHRPELLLLDEPSSGLDAVVRRDILAAIIRTVADEGRTVLFSSHLLDEVERVADHVAMIHAGKLVLNGPLDTIKESHRRITLRFAAPQPTRPTLPGALTCEGEGRDWTAICNGAANELRAAATTQGAEILEETIPSLEEIFVARVKA